MFITLKIIMLDIKSLNNSQKFRIMSFVFNFSMVHFVREIGYQMLIIKIRFDQIQIIW